MFLDLTENPEQGTVLLRVRVQPRASTDEVAGAAEGVLRIRLRAPAVENRANEALVEFLAALLKTPKSAVRIRSGEHGRNKCVEIRGVTRNAILEHLREEA